MQLHQLCSVLPWHASSRPGKVQNVENFYVSSHRPLVIERARQPPSIISACRPIFRCGFIGGSVLDVVVMFETGQDGTDGTSSTGAAQETPFYVCVTEYTGTLTEQDDLSR